jgi:hypothetical protein
MNQSNKSYSVTNHSNAIPTEISGFSVSKIIFDEGDFVTLWVNCRLQNKIQETHLVLSFAKLNDILRFSGEDGEKILLKMLDIMMFASRPPYVLDMLQDFESEIIITSCKLQISPLVNVYYTLQENCFLVDIIWPINIIQQAKNLKQHLQDFNSAKVIQQGNNNSQQLRKMYAHYLGLLELDIIETVARSRAHLTDGRLFQLAEMAHKQNI